MQNYCSAPTPRCSSRFSDQLAAGIVDAARSGALEAPLSRRVHSRQGGWSLDEVADAEMSHVCDSFGTVVVPEFRSGFLAGVHSGDSSAAGVMGRPLGDVVDFPCDDDPAVVSGAVPGDLFARDTACTAGRRSWLPQRAGNRGVVGLSGPAEVPRPQSLVR